MVSLLLSPCLPSSPHLHVSPRGFFSSGFVSDSSTKLATVRFAFCRVEFADVTNVGFPPIYEKFLSTIGIFSLDLGWLLSATCVASGVDFYDKLL